MQKDLQFLRKARAPHFSDEGGDSSVHGPYVSDFDGVFPPCAKPMPLHGVELQPSVLCPKNFIIFDQAYDRSQVMYHPELNRKLNTPALNGYATAFQNNYAVEQEASSSRPEDPNEIDALLSLDDEEEDNDDEEYEEEEVSTARTCGDYGSLSPDSCYPSYSCNDARMNSLSGSTSHNIGEKKRQKMKKMMRVLRGILPGGEEMNTASVLDEAVEYLKSLKVEAQKLGVGDYTSQA